MSNEIVIIGYSGHAYVCIDAAILQGFDITAYCDNQEKKENPYNLKYRGIENQLPHSTNVFIAIGDNSIRQKIVSSIALNYAKIIHPSSVISNSVLIGQGSFVAANAIINPLATLGDHCIINTSAIIEHECRIGDYVHIAPGATLSGAVEVGDLSFIGANSVIKQGVKIGENAIIGAGTVVIKDVPDNTTVVGNPGKILRRL